MDGFQQILVGQWEMGQGKTHLTGIWIQYYQCSFQQDTHFFQNVSEAAVGANIFMAAKLFPNTNIYQ